MSEGSIEYLYSRYTPTGFVSLLVILTAPKHASNGLTESGLDTEEPCAGIPHAGLCGGSGRQRLLLPGQRTLEAGLNPARVGFG